MKTTVIPSPAELRDYLAEAGTPGPSLHPDAPQNHPNDKWARNTWNGWNFTVTAGVEAGGRPFIAYLTHYASGHSDLAAGPVVGVPHGALKDDDLDRWAKAGVVFPVEVMPAIQQILHPEHTPKVES